jgi:hypothetical protein
MVTSYFKMEELALILMNAWGIMAANMAVKTPRVHSSAPAERDM